MAVLESWNITGDESVTGSVLGTTIDVANTSPGTYRDATGLLVFAANNTPRIDYDGDGNCIGLLVEEAMTQRGGSASQVDFTSGWIPQSCLIASDAETGPDGVATSADTMVDLNDSTSDNPYIQGSAIVSSGVRYVMSVFLKKITGNDWVYLQLGNQTSSTGRVWFDLANGVVGTSDSGMIASGIEKYASGWYRCWIALDMTTTTVLCNVALCASDGGTFYNSNGSKIAIRYFQLENPPSNTDAACRPTSYRTGSRSADVTTFSDCAWYDDGASGSFSFYAEYDAQGGQNATAFYFRAPLDSSCYIQAGWYGAPAQSRWWMLNNPGNDGIATASTLNNDGSIERLAGACTNGDQRLSCNGGTIGTDATFDYPLSDVVSTATIKYVAQSNAANSQLNGHLRALVFADDMWDDTSLTTYTTTGYTFSAGGGDTVQGMESGAFYRRRRLGRRKREWKRFTQWRG